MFRRLWMVLVPLVALSMLGFGIFHMLSAQQNPPPTPPPSAPARTPFGKSIGAAGLVEPRSENIGVGSPLPGVVLQLFVPADDVGRQVKTGDPLFRVDDRQLRAQLAIHEANLKAAEAQLAKLRQQPRNEEIPAAEARVRSAQSKARLGLDLYERAKKMIVSNSIGQEEYNTRRLNHEESLEQVALAQADLALLKAGAWAPDLAIAEAAVAQAKAQVDATQVEIDRTLVRAPVDGQVLQVNVRPGEFVASPSTKDLIVLGEIGPLRVRADVDEQDIPRFQPGGAATAFARGDGKQSIQLRFVRVEPYVVPKRSLTGENTERVDTRVLQVIYEVAPDSPPLFVGQQVDVFIDNGASAGQ